MSSTAAPPRPHVLIYLENLPIQRDSRVQRECRALLDAGYDVTVICPADREAGQPPEGVRVHAYRPPPEGSGVRAYLVEYGYSLLAATLLTIRVLRRRRVHAVQSCNPPDLFFLAALPMKLLGVKSVFDHHDPAPEIFLSHYGHRTSSLHRLVYRVLRRFERWSIRSAHHVIATNESLHAVATERAGKARDDVTIVRNGPPLALVEAGGRALGRPDGDRPRVCCWAGVMGADDGAEEAVAVLAELVHRHGRRDTHLLLMGDGERRPAVERRARELGVDEYLTMTGWLPLDRVYERMAASDVGLSLDPPSDRSELSTNIKVMEYMALGLPVVAFDGVETRRSAADAAVYADRGDIGQLADLLVDLLDDDERRAAMGARGRLRIEAGLAWEHQRDAYVRVFDQLLGVGP